MKSTSLTILALSVSGLILVGCGERYSWRQKLTVEVETPEGVVSGSSVTQVNWNDVNSVGNYPNSYSGEATVVDLGKGRFLFALIQEETKYLALHVFNGNGGISREIFLAMSKLRAAREVPISNYPMLVTFENINDPTSVIELDPSNLAAVFGAGYRLKSIILELTDEPMTKGNLEMVLEWIYSEEVLTNPTWGNLPQFSKKVIRGLRKPGGARK